MACIDAIECIKNKIPDQMKIKNNKSILKLICCMFITLLYSCNNSSEKYTDTPISGNISIAVDETFQPIADSEIKVFEGLYNSTSIKANYCSEKQAFDYLLKDSVRLIIVSRKLNQSEHKLFEDKKFFPKEVKIATDAIALIVNNENKDTLITIEELKDILTGKITNWKQKLSSTKLDKIQLVFDNQSSSTVRLILDSVCRGAKLSVEVKALDKNKEVIDFVSQNHNAIGIIGVSWVSNSSDSTSLSFLDRIKVMSVSVDKKATIENSYQPFQYYLSNGKYPLLRNVFVIISEPRIGLASGFTSFLASDKGQRIIKKSGILPATVPLNMVKMRSDL